MIIRDAAEADLPALRDIFNDAVLNTTAIWMDNVVDLANRQAWFAARAQQGYPILVAENGMATRDLAERADGWTREAYLTAHVEQLQRAVQDGVPVLGYIHWSITDNYEWGSYRPRFGLYSVECRTGDLRRVPTQAAETYRRVIAAGGVTPAIASTVRYPASYRPLARP